LSESESPLEPFSLPPGTALSPDAELLAATGHQGQTVEQVTLTQFFRNMVRPADDQDPAQQEIAQRFLALQTWRETHLQEVTVYRVGTTEVQDYVLGKTPAGDWLGLKTTLVET